MMITKKQREQIEVHICKVLDLIDPTKQNSDYYKEKFAEMSDTQFDKFLDKEFPIVLQTKLFDVEPIMANMQKAADYMKVPILERVAEPHLYKNKKGEPVWTKPALVVYIHHKRLQQMVIKKNKLAIDISGRDMKNGRLISDDKGAAMSDREFECLGVMGLNYSIKEFAKPKADALESKSYMYNTISTLGQVSQEDIPFKKEDGLAKNLMSSYLLACHINSNLVNDGNYTPYTISSRKRKVERD